MAAALPFTSPVRGTAGTDQRNESPGTRLGIGPNQTDHLMRSQTNANGGSGRGSWPKPFRGDVGDQVAKGIDPDHRPGKLPGTHAHGWPVGLRRSSGLRPSSCGSTPRLKWAATGAMMSRPWKVRDGRLAPVCVAWSAPAPTQAASCCSERGEQAVVGSNEVLPQQTRQQNSAVGCRLRDQSPRRGTYRVERPARFAAAGRPPVAGPEARRRGPRRPAAGRGFSPNRTPFICAT